MNTTIPTFSDLFAQLGLPCDGLSIAAFIKTHTPLAADIALPDADFWTSAQADFLREKLLEDADWANRIDQLSEALRARYRWRLDGRRITDFVPDLIAIPGAELEGAFVLHLPRRP